VSSASSGICCAEKRVALTRLMCFAVVLFYKNCPPKAFRVSVLDINAKGLSRLINNSAGAVAG